MARLSYLLFLTVCLTNSYQGVQAASETKVIESYHVKSEVKYRAATTQIESVVRNTAEVAQDILFDVALPKDAFIVGFFMEIDGKVYEGEVQEKGKAKQSGIATGRRGATTGHTKEAPRNSNIFQVSANVAKGSEVKFSLTYQEVLRRKQGSYEHEIYVSPGQVVKDFLIEVFIQENKPLKFVKCPAVMTGSLLTNKIYAESKVVKVPSPETVYLSYRPSLADQGDSGMSARFTVEYDIQHSSTGDVVINDGYFIYFYAVDIPPMPKDIIFILDVSGSMNGQNIQQLKEAMLEILGDLKPEDRFNIITFSSGIYKWDMQFVNVNTAMIEAARTFIRHIYATGGTDLNDALIAGAREMKAVENPNRAGIMFFLTDGEATSGVTDRSSIVANIAQANGKTSSIYGLAFGAGADYELLKTISSQNSGFARKIYEDVDAATQVMNLYDEISEISLKHLYFEYLPSSVDPNTVTKIMFPAIQSGGEATVSGKMADNATSFQMKLSGVGQSGPLRMDVEYDNLTELTVNPEETANTFFTTPANSSGTVEQMWAHLSIQQSLEEQENSAFSGTKTEELNDKVIQLAKKYNFVTPLTAMVVANPESPDTPVESILQDSDQISVQQSVLPVLTPAQQPHLYGQLRVSAFLVTTNKPQPFSLCLAPVRVQNNTYNLIEKANGTKVIIETACVGKNCSKMTIQNVTFENNGEQAVLTMDYNGDWMYQPAANISVTSKTSDSITIYDADSGTEMTFIRNIKKNHANYLINITLPTAWRYKGIIGHLVKPNQKMHQKWQKASAIPKACKGQQTAYSAFLNARMMTRYVTVF